MSQDSPVTRNKRPQLLSFGIPSLAEVNMSKVNEDEVRSSLGEFRSVNF